MTMLVQGPCAVPARIREARNGRQNCARNDGQQDTRNIGLWKPARPKLQYAHIGLTCGATIGATPCSMRSTISSA